MAWLVEHTNEFELWFDSLSSSEQEDVYASGLLLEQRGPNLRHPMSSGIKGSRHSHMRELRVQSGGKPLRIFYA
ncbi:type II toxin-antitoxin system RelE/ParE family toxin, partial [Acetobacter fabarum]